MVCTLSSRMPCTSGGGGVRVQWIGQHVGSKYIQ